jgi:hypothetical protein
MDTQLTIRALFTKKKVMLEVWLNVKLVGRIKFDKTQRNIA